MTDDERTGAHDDAGSTSIPPPDPAARAAAEARQAALTKPPGSLGRLERAAADLAAMQATDSPRVDPAVVVTMAADHGVAREAVSAYPQSVTAAMIENVLAGGAAINAVCGSNEIDLVVVDMGVAGVIDVDTEGDDDVEVETNGESDVDVETNGERDVDGDGRHNGAGDASAHVELVDAHIADGTANMAAGRAMTREQARGAIEAGRRPLAERPPAVPEPSVVGLGEMGIANTTASAAVTALLTDRAVADVTGQGTGINEETRARKIEIIERAIEERDPDPTDPLDVLGCVGGFEIAGLVGLTLEAASRRVPVVVDGVTTGAAALLASEIDPRVSDYLLGSHASVEPAHAAQLAALDLEPLFDYGMRLGEGTGAALAIGTYRAACAVHAAMATFAEAGVSTEE